MDAHDELFYRLNDPDPKVRAWAELQLIGQIFGATSWSGGSSGTALRTSCWSGVRPALLVQW